MCLVRMSEQQWNCKILTIESKCDFNINEDVALFPKKQIVSVA